MVDIIYFQSYTLDQGLVVIRNGVELDLSNGPLNFPGLSMVEILDTASLPDAADWKEADQVVVSIHPVL